MKANEFVKKYGWDRARQVVEHADPGAIQYVIELDFYSAGITEEDYVLLSELKRLIESYDLVQSYGGCNEAISYLNKKHIFAWDALDGQLSQAIADVESC